MDYEQRYKEALKIARDNYNAADRANINVESFKNALIAVFPELKESEDERIRKEIIKETKASELRLFETVTNDEFIAWLEKQGEQKPADKAEPKFKIGDWVICPELPPVQPVVQVVDIKDGQYELEYIDGTKEWFEINQVDNTYFHWTIEDAKDGDVLVSISDKPFLYNGKFTGLFVGAYCGLNICGNFIKCSEKCNWTNNENIKPATKEQRDFLLKEMHRVNYEWDADKKELIKL